MFLHVFNLWAKFRRELLYMANRDILLLHTHQGDCQWTVRTARTPCVFQRRFVWWCFAYYFSVPQGPYVRHN